MSENNETDNEMAAILSELDQKKESSDAKVILVTGGAGFIGSHVADFLLERGDKVVIIDEMNDYYDIGMKTNNLMYLYEKYDDKVVVFEADICDRSFVENVFVGKYILS